GQFFQQRRAIVRRHFVENPGHLFIAEGLNKLLLIYDLQIFKHLGGQGLWQDAKQHSLVVCAQVTQDFGNIGCGKIREDLAKLIEVPLPDQLNQLRLKQTADHAHKSNRGGKQMPSNKVEKYRNHLEARKRSWLDGRPWRSWIGPGRWPGPGSVACFQKPRALRIRRSIRQLFAAGAKAVGEELLFRSHARQRLRALEMLRRFAKISQVELELGNDRVQKIIRIKCLAV